MSVVRKTAIESEVFEGEISDEDVGIVRGAKLLGLRSRNKRNYDTEGVRKTAKVLLEGGTIYIDHPAKPNQPRSYKDSFGVASNVQFRAGQGYFGDIKYNPQHPLANQFAWDVKNNPNGLGLSINASYVGGRVGKDGFEDVKSLELIRSIDIVTKPATSKGIFESEDPDGYSVGKAFEDSASWYQYNGIVSEEEDEIMDLKTLKEKNPDLLEQVRAEILEETSKDADSVALQKQLLEAQEQLASFKKAEEDRKLREAVESDFGKLIDSFEHIEIEADLRKEILECACQMAEEARKPYRGVIEKMAKLVPPQEEDEDDEDVVVGGEEQEVEEQEEVPEKTAPRYRPGKTGKKSGSKSINLADLIGVSKTA